MMVVDAWTPGGPRQSRSRWPYAPCASSRKRGLPIAKMRVTPRRAQRVAISTVFVEHDQATTAHHSQLADAPYM